MEKRNIPFDINRKNSLDLSLNSDNNNNVPIGNDNIARTPQKYAGPKFHTSSPSASSLPIPVALMNSSNTSKMGSNNNILFSTSLPTSSTLNEQASSVLKSRHEPTSDIKITKGTANNEHSLKNVSYYSNRIFNGGHQTRNYVQSKHYKAPVAPSYQSLSDPESFSKPSPFHISEGRHGSRRAPVRDAYSQTGTGSAMATKSQSMTNKNYTHTHSSMSSSTSSGKSAKGIKKIYKRPNGHEESSIQTAAVRDVKNITVLKHSKSSLVSTDSTSSVSLREISLNLKQILKIVDPPLS